MTSPHDQPIYDLIVEVRGAFNALKAASDTMIADMGVTAAMRAVLEFLDQRGAHTVPQIAKSKTVTRQHIQVLADALAEKGLVRFRKNPGHKTSKLLELTADGQDLFARIRKRETQELDRLAANFDQAQLTAGADLLRRLRNLLSGL